MKTITFSILNLQERFLVLQLVTNVLKNKQEALPELVAIYSVLNQLRDDLEKAMFQSRGSAFTAKIIAQDEVQDNGFVCFRTLLEAYTHSVVDESLRAKALHIIAIIRRHGWTLYNAGNKKQLALSLSLINELMQADNWQLLEDLRVVNDFRAWKTAVEGMEQLYVDKAAAEAAKPDLKPATETAKEAVELLEKLLPGWSYQAEFGENEDYADLVNTIFDGVADLEQQARSRMTKKANEVEE